MPTFPLPAPTQPDAKDAAVSSRSRTSRALYRVDSLTGSTAASVLVTAIVVGFLLLLVVFDYPSSWEGGFSTVASGVTLVMVFVIQHTQSRQQMATQLKLDELIRSSPRADDRLVHIEVSGDEELGEFGQLHAEHHAAVRGLDDGESFDAGRD